MVVLPRILKCIVAAFAATLALVTFAHADDDELEALFEGLKTAEPSAVEQIEGRIYDLWSRSGSPAMDLLLERGRTALTDGDTVGAIHHFSALIDHAPDFAEGYNGRATAYFQEQKFGLSLEDIQRTLALNPRHFGAMSGLALILEAVGREESALLAWREVEKINPNRDGLADAITRLERMVEGETL